MILFVTENAIVSPDIISPSTHPKYLILECCLICISPYSIFSFLTFFILNLVAKSIDLVLWSVKSFSGKKVWIFYLSVISTNLSSPWGICQIIDDHQWTLPQWVLILHLWYYWLFSVRQHFFHITSIRSNFSNEISG